MIYDHECTGESAPGDPMMARDVLFSHWVQDIRAVVEQLTEGPIVLVGCSMGGKLALISDSAPILFIFILCRPNFIFFDNIDCLNNW